LKRRFPAAPEKKEPRPEHVTREQVLAYLATLSKPVSIRELAHGMGLKHRQRRYVPRILTQLERSGEIGEVHGGRYFLVGEGAERRNAAGRPAPRGAQQAPPTPENSERQGKSKRPRDPNLIAGRITAHRDGYAFLVPDHPIKGVEGDLFIGRDSLEDAMHGDRVLARITRRRPDGRAEGRVVQIVERENPTVVGLFRYGPHGNHVLPYDARLQHEVLIPPGEEIPPSLREKAAANAGRRTRFAELDGAVVDVEIVRFPRGGLSPAGRVVEILGRPGDIGVDVEIMIRKHHLPHVFSAAVVADAQATPQKVDEQQVRGRRDFRHLPIVTIDGETARDFDDAVYTAALPNGHFELQVHIADVAHYVPRGSALDREARLRGTSVYFPNRAVPMLPEELSNGICSLNPCLDRLVMSVILEIDAQGEPVAAQFAPGVIRSVERMTYTNVNNVLEGDPEMTQRYAALADEFRRMKQLALLLNKRRVARGSIDFDLPEPVIEFDPDGNMRSIIRSERNIAHRLIEEFMLAANEAVAEYLDSRAIASLYRVHEKPDPKKVLEFEELAQAFGYSLGVTDLSERRIAVRHGQSKPQAHGGHGGRGHGNHQRVGRARTMTVTLPDSEEVNIRPQHYQRLTEKIAGKPEERILSYLMLRSLKQARYAAEPLGHFALAAIDYTHFTSPIRRYPDLIVHRALKWALENPEAAAPAGWQSASQIAAQKRAGERVPERKAPLGPYRLTELEEIASESSESERRADGAERELMDWKTAQFMEGHLGEECDALIISVQKFGFFVELTEIFVEGLVSIDRLEEATGQHCVYRDRDRTIVAEPHRASRSRSGGPGQRVFRMGDRVRVRAERIDPMRHRVEFAVVF
jgi:ribonuclease R